MEYAQKLKDPRWQKKRLDILNRDSFSCQKCFDDKNTLHVHHIKYFKGKEPWDIEDRYLITLCESCHETEGEDYKMAMDELKFYIEYHSFLSSDIEDIVSLVKTMGDGDFKGYIFIDLLIHVLENNELFKYVDRHYYESIKNKTNGKKVH